MKSIEDNPKEFNIMDAIFTVNTLAELENGTITALEASHEHKEVYSLKVECPDKNIRCFTVRSKDESTFLIKVILRERYSTSSEWLTCEKYEQTIPPYIERVKQEIEDFMQNEWKDWTEADYEEEERVKFGDFEPSNLRHYVRY